MALGSYELPCLVNAKVQHEVVVASKRLRDAIDENGPQLHEVVNGTGNTRVITSLSAESRGKRVILLPTLWMSLQILELHWVKQREVCLSERAGGEDDAVASDGGFSEHARDR